MKEKLCPRCGAPFICNHENISKCQCAAIVLSASQHEKLKQTYPDCLCINCLKELFTQ
ncbi:MAG: cysteine-rich CWC family protein [Paludibacteraceae bacterium]|nr:cysteine-rich CWC family protein [Paludibacteraceae bacterium]